MSKKKKNNYFTKVHQEAIVKYVLSDDMEEKKVLYRDFIQPAFDELVDNYSQSGYFDCINGKKDVDNIKGDIDEIKVLLFKIAEKL